MCFLNNILFTLTCRNSFYLMNFMFAYKVHSQLVLNKMEKNLTFYKLAAVQTTYIVLEWRNVSHPHSTKFYSKKVLKVDYLCMCPKLIENKSKWKPFSSLNFCSFWSNFMDECMKLMMVCCRCSQVVCSLYISRQHKIIVQTDRGWYIEQDLSNLLWCMLVYL